MPEASLQVVWQPIVSLQTGVPCGFECLIRSPHVPDGPSPVPDLISTHGPKLDLHFVRLALRTLPLLPAGLKLFVNVLPGTLLCLVSRVPRVARHPGVVWEISERAGGHALRREQLDGIQYALDDLGHHNLSLVSLLRPPWLKLDSHLVADLHRDPVRRELVRGIVQAAAAYGGVVVAEGVEQDDELVALRDCGVPYGQGYLLGRPAAPWAWTLRLSQAAAAKQH